jgi:hypothetical protein
MRTISWGTRGARQVCSRNHGAGPLRGGVGLELGTSEFDTRHGAARDEMRALLFVEGPSSIVKLSSVRRPTAREIKRLIARGRIATTWRSR